MIVVDDVINGSVKFLHIGDEVEPLGGEEVAEELLQIRILRHLAQAIRCGVKGVASQCSTEQLRKTFPETRLRLTWRKSIPGIKVIFDDQKSIYNQRSSMTF